MPPHSFIQVTLTDTNLRFETRMTELGGKLDTVMASLRALLPLSPMDQLKGNAADDMALLHGLQQVVRERPFLRACICMGG